MTSPSFEHGDVAALIGDNLAALPHPDGGIRTVAGFAAGGLMPEVLRDQMRQQALEVGQAVVQLIESNGWTITRAGTQAAAPTVAEPGSVRLHCRHCDAVLLTVSLAHGPRAVTDGAALIRAISALRAECPHAV